jgi:tetratricopeptide (TPR) repeat protein
MLAAFSWRDGDSIAAEKYEVLFIERLNDFGMGWQDVDHNLGVNLLDMGSYDLAVKFFRSAATTDPKVPGTRACLSEALYASGDTTGAIKEAEQALLLDSLSLKAHQVLGTIYDQQGNRECAVRHYRTYLSLDSISTTANRLERRLSALLATID